MMESDEGLGRVLDRRKFQPHPGWNTLSDAVIWVGP